MMAKSHYRTLMVVVVLMVVVQGDDNSNKTDDATKTTVTVPKKPSTKNSTAAPTTTAPPTTTVTVTPTGGVKCANSTGNENKTCEEPSENKPNSVNGILHNFGVSDENFQMYARAFYVIMGVAGLVVTYLVVKTIIMRRKKKKPRQYGVLNDRHLELNAVDDDEEDDLFDQSRRLIT